MSGTRAHPAAPRRSSHASSVERWWFHARRTNRCNVHGRLRCNPCRESPLENAQRSRWRRLRSAAPWGRITSLAKGARRGGGGCAARDDEFVIVDSRQTRRVDHREGPGDADIVSRRPGADHPNRTRERSAQERDFVGRHAASRCHGHRGAPPRCDRLLRPRVPRGLSRPGSDERIRRDSRVPSGVTCRPTRRPACCSWRSRDHRQEGGDGDRVAGGDGEGQRVAGPRRRLRRPRGCRSRQRRRPPPVDTATTRMAPAPGPAGSRGGAAARRPIRRPRLGVPTCLTSYSPP